MSAKTSQTTGAGVLPPTTLITGASSGLGAEYARQVAARGDALVLVARDEQSLESLAAQLREQHGVPVEVLPADLLDAAGLDRVVGRLRSSERPVGTLINNAGFGLPLEFEENDIEAEVRLQRLHNEVPMRLMHAALRTMLARGSGRIVNIASVAAFIPRSTYSAVKQWLVTFSRWANGRYAMQGVSVTAVCPGYTHTNFHERLGLPPGEEGIPGWMWLDAAKVVAESLRDVDRGSAVSIPSRKYKAIVAVARFAPPALAARLGERGR
ncbi:SDR family NAD(P)-dependent oxidoreductase [Leucobacter komagatae]|uniref:SDR family NAD(P)-dependent oxidoreductase n=1 Tax=Leucobacter komagatae TaxID=55969 RepID=UPI0005ACE7C5|nr:SDR family NAD(P)-dependent oxidoreductase [Leucobacter komagatae]